MHRMWKHLKVEEVGPDSEKDSLSAVASKTLQLTIIFCNIKNNVYYMRVYPV